MKQNKKLVLFAVCPACYSLFMGGVFCVKGEQERIAIGCKIRAAGKQKFFGAAVFQKCCRGVGEQPTFAEQIVFEMVVNYEPQANESFLIQQFFKNVGEVQGEQP